MSRTFTDHGGRGYQPPKLDGWRHTVHHDTHRIPSKATWVVRYGYT